MTYRELLELLQRMEAMPNVHPNKPVVLETENDTQELIAVGIELDAIVLAGVNIDNAV